MTGNLNFGRSYNIATVHRGTSYSIQNVYVPSLGLYARYILLFTGYGMSKTIDDNKPTPCFHSSGGIHTVWTFNDVHYIIDTLLRRGHVKILKRLSLSLSAEFESIFCDLLASVSLVNKNGCKGKH